MNKTIGAGSPQHPNNPQRKPGEMATKNKAIYVITTFQRIPPTYKLDKTAKIHLHGAESVNTKQWQKGLGPPSTPTMADRDHCVDEDNKSSQSLQKVETCPQQRCHRIKAPTRLNNIRRDGIQVGKLRDQRTLSDETRKKILICPCSLEQQKRRQGN